MSTIEKEIISELADLVFDMMDSNENFDMSVVECLTEDFLQQNGLKFKDYTDLLIEFDGDDSAREFLGYADTAGYFFDTINSLAITKKRVHTIVGMCVTTI